MKLLLDILHPAHVHFFRNAVAELAERGHQVLVTARDKDLTLRLLDLYGIPYRCLSKQAGSKAGLARELVSRNLALLRLVRRERPAVLASIGGISTAQMGFLTRTRNLIFYDTENATLSNVLSYPFATEVVTPDCYKRKVLGRHVTYPGYHELAYLHPRRFTPDPAPLRAVGVSVNEPYTVVRFVSWAALHDVGARGFSLEQRKALFERLQRFGKVYVTSEAELPEAFALYRLPVPPDKVHHLLAFAALFVGESATMASESVILGTPAVYLDAVGRGYTDEQQSRYGLCSNFRPAEADRAIDRAEQLLSSRAKSDAAFRARVSRMLSDKVDVTDYVVGKLTE